MTVASRRIEKVDLIHAAEVNDAIAEEHGRDDVAIDRIGEELGLDVKGTATIGAAHAMQCLTHINDKSAGEYKRIQRIARHDITHAYAMGVLTALRAVHIIGR